MPTTEKVLSPTDELRFFVYTLGGLVRPLAPNSKIPFKNSSREEASSDPDQIRAWLKNTKYSGCNWALLTGAESGFVIVDMDSYKEDFNLDELTEKYGSGWLSPIWWETGRGGRQYLYKYPQDRLIPNSKGKIANSVDIRGHGGYGVIPPSAVPEGKYILKGISEEVPELPEWIIEQTCRTYLSDKLALITDTPVFNSFPQNIQDRIHKYVTKAQSNLENNLKTKATGWNNTAFYVCCSIMELAKAPWTDLTAEEAEIWYRSQVEKYLPFDQGSWNKDRLELTIKSAKTTVNNQGDKCREFPFSEEDIKPSEPIGKWNASPLNWGTLFTEKTEINWHVSQIVEHGQQITINGDGKAGKSLISLDLAASIATGKPLFTDFEDRPLRVVYLDRENQRISIRERIQALGFNAEELEGQLLYFTPEMFNFSGSLNENLIAVSEFMDMVEQLKPDVVFLDTISRFISGDENSSKPWLDLYNKIHAPLKGRGITGIRLDHLGKDGSKGARGNSAKSQDVDHVWELVASPDRESDGQVITDLTFKRTHTRTGHGDSYYKIARTGVKSESGIWIPGETKHTLEKVNKHFKSDLSPRQLAINFLKEKNSIDKVKVGQKEIAAAAGVSQKSISVWKKQDDEIGRLMEENAKLPEKTGTIKDF